jgi:hypothetical protein
MGFIFSLYRLLYIGQFVKIENIAILELRVCQNCTFREAYIFPSAGQINFRACIIATLGLRGMAQVVCAARLQFVLQKLTYNKAMRLVTLKILYFPTVYTIL